MKPKQVSYAAQSSFFNHQHQNENQRSENDNVKAVNHYLKQDRKEVVTLKKTGSLARIVHYRYLEK